ncbi:hypothetical protein AVEN_154164-1 [Araneus ventricosus]|uniref:Uncharacterized protein n=1 Tax=Araneus ventricosus TaxID=182803 RepID=A0A4Y2GGU8_ARAVE|nr:hypothetical protein AVEN_154164-1 [Araneus ventricosus]
MLIHRDHKILLLQRDLSLHRISLQSEFTVYWKIFEIRSERMRTTLFLPVKTMRGNKMHMQIALPDGRGGLVIRSRPRNRRVAGSKLDSTEDPPFMEHTLHTQSYGPNALPLVRHGSLERGASSGVVLVI